MHHGRQEAVSGLDVGGTSVKMGLFDEAGELLGKGDVPTPPLIDSAGYTAVTDGITALLGAASEQVERVRGIGLAIPCPGSRGRRDPHAGQHPDQRPRSPGRLDAAAQRGGPFENDADAAAMGELSAGAQKGFKSFVFVTIGTGVGGGVVVDGHVVSGGVGAGGEIGHLCMNPTEERSCGCGGKGHLEQYASATGIVAGYKAACEASDTEPVELEGPERFALVFEAAKNGDEAAWTAIDSMCDYLGAPVP